MKKKLIRDLLHIAFGAIMSAILLSTYLSVTMTVLVGAVCYLIATFTIDIVVQKIDNVFRLDLVVYDVLLVVVGAVPVWYIMW